MINDKQYDKYDEEMLILNEEMFREYEDDHDEYN